MGESIRLQKILAQAGCGSRRACEVFITDGRVTVDGIIVRQLGSKADPETQTIELDSNKIAGPGKLAKGVKASGEHVYWMLNKPKGVLCTNEDPSGRALAVHMVPEKRRVFCVGRLDKDTEGLIILTNDGELTNQLTHPRYGVEKVYVARVDGRAMPQQIAKLQRGVHLAEGKTQGARVRLRKAAGSQSVLELTISEGMNRQVRRMLAAVGLYVRGLKRVSVGPVRLGEIGPGESRLLTSDELDRLRAAIRTAQKEAEKPAAVIQEVEEESDEDRAPQKKAKKEPGEKLKRRDAKHKAAHPTEEVDEDAPKTKRQKSWSSEESELPDMDEAIGTRTALTPVDDDGSTTQEAPAIVDVVGDATQAASAIDKELEGDDSDEDDGEFGVEMDDEELSEAETAPQQPIEAGDDDEDDEDDVEADGDDEDGIVIKRKKNLNAAAALDDDEDTAEMDAGVEDGDDEPFDTANPLAGKNEKKWVDRGDREDPRLNAAAADKQHREEERENRKRQRTAAAAREGSAAGKPRGDYRAPGGRSGGRGEYKPRQNQGRPARGGQGGDRAPRPYGDRPQSGGGDRDRSDHFRPRSGPKFSGPKRDSPAFDKRKTWGDVQRGASEGRGGERPYQKREGSGAPRGDREGGRPAWKSSGPRKDGERKTWTPRKDGERKTWTPRKDGERKAWSGPPRERTGGSSGGDRGPRPQSREGGAPRGDRPYQKKTYGDRPSYGGGGGQKRPYSPGGARPERADRGGADKRGPRPEWRGSSSGGAGGRKPDSRSGGGDRPRAPRADGEKRGFSPRPWEKSRGGSGGSGGSRGGSGGGGGGAGPRQTRPWEKREPRSGGSDRPKRNEGGDE